MLRSGLAFPSETAPAAARVEKRLEVIAVEVGAAKDQALVHLERVSDATNDVGFQAFRRQRRRVARVAIATATGSAPAAAAAALVVHVIDGRGWDERGGILGVWVHDVHGVMHGVRDVFFALEIHPRGFATQRLGEFRNLGRMQRRGEEQHLQGFKPGTGFRHAREQTQDVALVAGVQQPIRLVQHEESNAGETQLAGLDQVEHATGRADGDVATPAKRLHLRLGVHAAHEQTGGDARVGEIRAERLEVRVGLFREVARGLEHQRERRSGRCDASPGAVSPASPRAVSGAADPLAGFRGGQARVSRRGGVLEALPVRLAAESQATLGVFQTHRREQRATREIFRHAERHPAEIRAVLGEGDGPLVAVQEAPDDVALGVGFSVVFERLGV